MKFSSIIAASAPVASLATASPLITRASNAVQVLPKDIHGPNVSALKKAPTNMAAGDRAFLEKYQPLAGAASDFIGQKNNDDFTSAGSCYAEFPCFSVQRGAVASIGTQAEVSKEQVSSILDQLVSSPNVTFDQSNKDTPFSGLKMTKDGAVLEVIASNGQMDSKVLAGMAFDTFKMQAGSAEVNSVRATQAASDGKQPPFLALCLYPAGVDTQQAYNFCVGKELDGSVQVVPSTGTKAKRFSLEALLNGACALLDIPLLCKQDKH